MQEEPYDKQGTEPRGDRLEGGPDRSRSLSRKGRALSVERWDRGGYRSGSQAREGRGRSLDHHDRGREPSLDHCVRKLEKVNGGDCRTMAQEEHRILSNLPFVKGVVLPVWIVIFLSTFSPAISNVVVWRPSVWFC